MGINALADHAFNFPNLEFIDLTDNRIGMAGVKALTKLGSKIPIIDYIDISSNQIGD